MNIPKNVLVLLALATCQVGWSQLQINSVVNSASYVNYLPEGGSLASIFISGLAGTPGLVTAPTDSPLPSQLAGIEVLVDGIPSPILAVYIPASGSTSSGQINFQVPFVEWNVGPTSYIEVEQFISGSEAPLTAMFTPYEIAGLPEGFFADQNGFGIAQHASDYSLITSQNPAQPGETIMVYANDFFQVWPPTPIGFPTPSQPLFVATTTYPAITGYLFLGAPPSLNLTEQGSCPSPAGVLPVDVTFEGLAPGLVGVEQINFVVPANQQPGTYALYFNNGTTAQGICDPLGYSSSSQYVMIPVG